RVDELNQRLDNLSRSGGTTPGGSGSLSSGGPSRGGSSSGGLSSGGRGGGGVGLGGSGGARGGRRGGVGRRGPAAGPRGGGWGVRESDAGRAERSDHPAPRARPRAAAIVQRAGRRGELQGGVLGLHQGELHAGRSRVPGVRAPLPGLAQGRQRPVLDRRVLL